MKPTPKPKLKTFLVWTLLFLVFFALLQLTGDGPKGAGSFADFVHWQTDLLASPDGRRQRSFWEERLAGAPHVLDLPTDWSRPPRFTYHASGVPCEQATFVVCARSAHPTPTRDVPFCPAGDVPNGT